VFDFFGGQFCDIAKVANHPPDNLAKFAYEQDIMKLFRKKKILLCFWLTPHLNQVKEIWQSLLTFFNSVIKNPKFSFFLEKWNYFLGH
jgi:hypothetical protein